MSNWVADYYRRHHSDGGRYGFTVEGDIRSSFFGDHLRAAAERRGAERLQVLDIGCRDGTLTRTYAAGHDVEGLDIDPDAVERANAAGGGLRARWHDLNTAGLPFDDASFDAVVAGEVLEHLQLPAQVVVEIHRVLRKGGVFVGSVPNAFRLPNRLKFLMGREFEIDPTHLHSFSPGALRRTLGAFVDVRVEFQGGRRRKLHPELFATQMCWVARR